MTTIEERLWSDLPALADLLANEESTGGSVPTPRLTAKRAKTKQPSRRLVLAAATALAIVGLAGAGWWAASRGDGRLSTTDDSGTERTTSTVPVDPYQPVFGEWSATAESPIPTRAFPVMEAMGDEVIVWAGSSLDRSFAYTDGALYNPTTDTWRDMPLPGWGHPGLGGSLVVNDRLLVFAKGSGEALSITGEPSISLSHRSATLMGAVRVGDETWVYGTAFGEPAVLQLNPLTWDWIGELQVADPRVPTETDDSLIEAPTTEPTTSRTLELPPWPAPSGDRWFGAGVGTAGTDILFVDGTRTQLFFDTTTAEWRRILLGGGVISVLPSSVGDGPLGQHFIFLTADSLSGTPSATGLFRGASVSGIFPLDDLPSTNATLIGVGRWFLLIDDNQPIRQYDTVSAKWGEPGPVTAPGASAVAVELDTGPGVVIWGGSTSEDEPTAGVLWRAPAGQPTLPDVAALVDDSEPQSVTTEPAPGTPSQSAEDAERDGVAPVVARLYMSDRVGTTAGAGEVADTPEGTWVLSRPPELKNVSCLVGDMGGVYGVDFLSLCSYQELLLLDSETGSIIRSYPFADVSVTSIAVTEDAIWCAGESDGANPFSTYCRIDRATLEATVLLVGRSAREVAEDFDFERDWHMSVPPYWEVVHADPALAIGPNVTLGETPNQVAIPAWVLVQFTPGVFHL